MGREIGSFNFANNFELGLEGVIDARQLVDDFSDLLNFNSSDFIPLGFTVSVKGVQDPLERGIYQCINKNDLSNPDSWEKIGGNAQGFINKPIKYTLFSSLNLIAQFNSIEDFCRIVLNANTPIINLEEGDIPFFNVLYNDEFVVFTLNGVETNVSLGQGQPNITTEQIQIISRRPLNVGSIDDTSTDYIDIIATVSDTDNVWERVNLDSYSVQPLSEGFTVFRAEVNGEILNWLYKGESGAVGLNGYQTLEDDFQLLNPSESGIPTLQQVIDASGNVVYAEFPTGTYIEDDGGSFSIQLGNSFLRINSNGSLELDAQQLILKGSNASLVGRALVVQADGSVAWKNISVDLSDYYTKAQIDFIISELELGIPEAPQDGNQYARKDGAWEQVQATGSVTQPPQLVNGVVQVDLSNPQGIFSESTVTTTEQFEVIAGAVTGGIHVFRVNLPTDPDASITGATRYVNSEFIPDVNLLLVFERFNFGTRYYFLEI